MEAKVIVYSPMSEDRPPVTMTLDSKSGVITLEQGDDKIEIHITDLSATVRSLSNTLRLTLPKG